MVLAHVCQLHDVYCRNIVIAETNIVHSTIAYIKLIKYNANLYLFTIEERKHRLTHTYMCNIG